MNGQAGTPSSPYSSQPRHQPAQLPNHTPLVLKLVKTENQLGFIAEPYQHGSRLPRTSHLGRSRVSINSRPVLGCHIRFLACLSAQLQRGVSSRVPHEVIAPHGHIHTPHRSPFSGDRGGTTPGPGSPPFRVSCRRPATPGTAIPPLDLHITPTHIVGVGVHSPQPDPQNRTRDTTTAPARVLGP